MITSSGSIVEKSDFMATTNRSMNVPRKTFYKIEEKLKILDKIKLGAKKCVLIQKFKINFSTLSNWIKNEKKLREANQHSKFTVHKGPKLRLCPDEKHILAFIHKKNQNQEVIYTRDVIKEAIKISPLMKNLGSKALFAWVYRFFKRNLINFSNGFDDAEKTTNAKKTDFNSSNLFANADENGSGKGKNNLFSAVTAFTESCSAEASEACSSNSSQIFGLEKFRDTLEVESAEAQLTLRKSRNPTCELLVDVHNNNKNKITVQNIFKDFNAKNNNDSNVITKKNVNAKKSEKLCKNNQVSCYFLIRKENKKARQAQQQQEQIKQEQQKSHMLTDYSLITNANSALCEVNLNFHNNNNNFASGDQLGIEDKTEMLEKYQNNGLAGFADIDFYCENLNNLFNFAAFEGIN